MKYFIESLKERTDLIRHVIKWYKFTNTDQFQYERISLSDTVKVCLALLFDRTFEPDYEEGYGYGLGINPKLIFVFNEGYNHLSQTWDALHLHEGFRYEIISDST